MVSDNAIRYIDNFYIEKDEPAKSCLLALREIILEYDGEISEAWKYGMPFFLYKRKMFCYIWTDKKSGKPYVGIVEGGNIDHPKLQKGKRARMKIFPIDPWEDMPVKSIYAVLSLAKRFYK